MSGKSFYDLGYIIEINEQWLEQYNAAYESIMQKLTNIIVIYSAMAIFLIPIPYLGCFGIYIANVKDDVIQKIEIVNKSGKTK